MGQPPLSWCLFLFFFLLLVSSFLTSLSSIQFKTARVVYARLSFRFVAPSFLLFWLMASCWVSYKSLLRHFLFSIKPFSRLNQLFSIHFLQIKTRRRWRLNNNSSHGSTPATSKPPTVHRPKTNGSRWEENAPPNRKFVSCYSLNMTPHESFWLPNYFSSSLLPPNTATSVVACKASTLDSKVCVNFCHTTKVKSSARWVHWIFLHFCNFERKETVNRRLRGSLCVENNLASDTM